jgi:hypothetical protein
MTALNKESLLEIKLKRLDEIFRTVIIVVSLAISASSVNLNLFFLLFPLFIWSIGHGMNRFKYLEFFFKLLAWFHLSFATTVTIFKATLGVATLGSALIIFCANFSALTTHIVISWFSDTLDVEQVHHLRKNLTILMLAFFPVVFYYPQFV